MNIFLISGVLLFSIGAAPLNGMLNDVNLLDVGLDGHGGSIDREIGTFTAYTSSTVETDSYPSTMASGNKVYVGAIACPSAYEFGTRIRILGMGLYTCEDRMARRHRRKKHRFDIFMQSRKAAIEFGVRKLPYEVVVLEGGT